MKRLNLLLITALLSISAIAQEKFELGKPNDSNYRYLDDYQALKAYIDYSKYPNFKLGIGTTVNDYLNNSLVKDMTNKNFTETVAGNAMKMASCVDGNGDMNFTTVKNYVEAATNILTTPGQNYKMTMTVRVCRQPRSTSCLQVSTSPTARKWSSISLY